jgi:TonB family protein
LNSAFNFQVCSAAYPSEQGVPRKRVRREILSDHCGRRSLHHIRLSVKTSIPPARETDIVLRGGAENDMKGFLFSTIRRCLAAGAGVLLLAVIAPAAADSPPQIDRSYPTPQPSYPQGAQLAGEQGDVTVDVLVSTSGKPRKIRINTSSGFADLDSAAVETVANWRFIPAVENGDTASAWTTVKLQFRLPQSAQAAPPPTN